jgi:hypothetical protein
MFVVGNDGTFRVRRRYRKILIETFSMVASLPFNVNERRDALKVPEKLIGLPSNVT